jgi:hypothetical protein
MPHPEIFYKYTSADSTCKILESSRLKWSSPSLFNDISEFQIMPEFFPSLNESMSDYISIIIGLGFSNSILGTNKLSSNSSALLKLVKEAASMGIDKKLMHKKFSQKFVDYNLEMDLALREHVEKDINTARILCVTTSFDNDALWGNYSESHNGCVLGFRHLQNTPLLEAEPIIYSDKPTIIGTGLEFLLFGMNRNMLTLSHKAICFTKKSSWSYEKEWRAITWRLNEKTKLGFYLFFPDELESITLGVRTTIEYEKIIRELVKFKYFNTKVYRMQNQKGHLVRTLC